MGSFEEGGDVTSLQAVKCKMGLHKWGERQFVTTFEKESSESCRSRRICSYCNETEIRDEDEHPWSEWGDAERACIRTRRCKRCGAEEKTLLHDWTEWKVTPERCEETRACSSCAISESRERHRWGQWTAEEGRNCTRCHKKDPLGKFPLCTEACQCDVCNGDIAPGEGYSVPLGAFYNSEKYREWLENGPMAFAINTAGGLDNFLREEMCCDGRGHCAVCKRCIEMFLEPD
jgi:hypothetical protein